MLSKQDIAGFFAAEAELNLADYAIFEYIFECAEDPELAAASLCCEQSTAQWKRPGVDEDFRPEYGAKVISLEDCRGGSPSPPGTKSYRVRVAHPHKNFGPRIPNLLSAAAGEGPFYCPGIERIKWIDFELPASFLNQFEGPQFGLAGVRERLKVYERPIFFGVVKPNIGLPPEDFAAIAYQSWQGGLDIAKDDEMLADTTWSPLVERTQRAVSASQQAAKETGTPKFFLPNITDEVDLIPELYQQVKAVGAPMVMINSIFTGYSSLRALRRYAEVPIVSHFTGTAVFSRLPHYGISSLVATKLQRLAGADVIIMAGFGERMGCSDEEVQANVAFCLQEWGDLKPVLPVPGGSDSAETLPLVFEKIRHADFGFICGRGVYGHPKGPAAGAASLHEAWDKIAVKLS